MTRPSPVRTAPPSHPHQLRRAVQLVLASVAIGAGVVLLLRSTLGADGYSMFVSGLSRWSGLPFAVANGVTGLALVTLAATRGVRPGVGTLVQPLVVGLTVQVGLGLLDAPDALAPRVLLALASLPVLAVGVAGYLGTRTGAGPPEAATLAFDPPVPFRVGYGVLQAVLAGAGFALGADLGPVTLLIVVGVGPLVHVVQRRAPWLVHAGSPAADTAGRRRSGDVT